MLVKVVGAGSVAVVFFVVVIAAVVGTVAVYDHPRPPAAPPANSTTPSPAARADIPPALLALYQRAAADCPGLDWSVLAAIGKVETDHGRSSLPGVRSGENFAGAGGLMQFEASTFDSVVSRHHLPAGGAHPPSRYDPSDAIHAAAYYLCDSGAPGDLHRAIFAYNHSEDYVNQVLGQAARYRLDPPPGSGDCHTIRAASRAAAQAISFACTQLGQPYVWGGNGPEVNGGWDCSGLVQAAYARAGITLPRTTDQQVTVGPRVPENAVLPGDLLFFGTAANVHHVGLYLGAGKMIEAADVGIPVRTADFRGRDFYAATRPAAASPVRGGTGD